MKLDYKEILKTMIKIRLVEQYISKRYAEQEMKCPAHLCVGQEAVPAVFGALAQRDDVFSGTYRSHGHYIAKGGDVVALFAELLGKPNGCARGFGGSMHVIDVENNMMGTSAIVGSGIPIAAGAAFAHKYKGKRSIAFAFFGDGALEEGVVYETVNFAVLHGLPLMLVCENNGLAVETPLKERQASLELHRRFESLGMRGVRVAQNNVEELAIVAGREIKQVRAQQEPFFLECLSRRFAVHVGPSIDERADLFWQDPYSEKADDCPIASCVRALTSRNDVTLEQVNAWCRDIQAEVESAYEHAHSTAGYNVEESPNTVYASPNQSVIPTKFSTNKHEFSKKEQSKLKNPF